MSRSVFGMAFPVLDKYHKPDSDAGCAKKYLHFVLLRPWTAKALQPRCNDTNTSAHRFLPCCEPMIHQSAFSKLKRQCGSHPKDAVL